MYGVYVLACTDTYRQRSYHGEHTGSRPITEVKLRRAWSVLGWVTAWENQVPLAFPFYFLQVGKPVERQAGFEVFYEVFFR